MKPSHPLVIVKFANNIFKIMTNIYREKIINLDAITINSIKISASFVSFSAKRWQLMPLIPKRKSSKK